MPEVKPGESEKEFVSRCIPYVMKDEGITDNKHAAAKCYGIYRQSKKKGESISRSRERVDEVVRKYLANEAGWSGLPKGWTEESAMKFWNSLTGDAEHKITACMEKMEGKVDDPGAFCGGLASRLGER